MKRVNWLVVATLALTLFVQPNKANAFNNGSLNGTYRGRSTGSFYSLVTSLLPLTKFDWVTTDTFTFDGNGHTTETFTYTFDTASASSPYQAGPCTDSAKGTYLLNPDGSGTSEYTVETSNCGDTGGTYTFAFTTDGEYIYRILTSDTSFAAFSIAGTSVKDHGNPGFFGPPNF
jgi:hypothetical protein